MSSALARARSSPTQAGLGSIVARVLWVCAVVLGAPACWTPTPRSIPEWTGTYDTLPEEPRRHFEEARRNIQAKKLGPARVTLERLAREHPDNIVVGAWLQEVEIALLDEALETDRAAAVAPDAEPADAIAEAPSVASPIPDPMAELRDRYRHEAEASPTVTRLVLAARIENDPVAARLLLERAEELDPDCAWVHYGRAFLAARAANWAEVRLRIARAKEGDPGHLPTRWLEAWMLSRGANVNEAITAIEAWLDRARDDLRIDARSVQAAELDLALLCVLDDQPKRAREILDELRPFESEIGRRYEILASVDQALGDDGAALDAARAAEAASPGELLPLVQQALLHEQSGDTTAAEAAWASVLAVSRTSPELNALLERLRARVKLERYRAAEERAALRRESAAR